MCSCPLVPCETQRLLGPLFVVLEAQAGPSPLYGQWVGQQARTERFLCVWQRSGPEGAPRRRLHL